MPGWSKRTRWPSVQSLTERDRISTFLDREDVRKEMQAQGVNANATKARVAALTDEEVHKIAGNMDMLPAGGDGGVLEYCSRFSSSC